MNNITKLSLNCFSLLLLFQVLLLFMFLCSFLFFNHHTSDSQYMHKLGFLFVAFYLAYRVNYACCCGFQELPLQGIFAQRYTVHYKKYRTQLYVRKRQLSSLHDYMYRRIFQNITFPQQAFLLCAALGLMARARALILTIVCMSL